MCRINPTLSHALVLMAVLLLGSATARAAQPTPGPLTLETAIARAIETDPWLGGSRQTEQALLEEAVAASSLPDPQLSLRAMNLPVGSFDIGQENMTQLAVGISQQFPRGRTRALAREQKEALAAAEPLLRADRRAWLAAAVTRVYLDAYLADASRALIEGDRALFEQLVAAAESQYATALGQARQQNLIRAQLELTRLDDRLTALQQQQEKAQRRLAEFVSDAGRLPLDRELPHTGPAIASRLLGPASDQSMFELMRRHPAVLAVEQRIDSVATGVALARQKYRPGWGLSAQYGYRAEDPAGRSRDDLLSVGLTFELPLFRADRQDREVNAATAREAAAWTERDLLVRRLVAELEGSRAEFARLTQRQRLYDQQLLPQMSQQAEASLTAYNSADGDFAEAVRARIAELDAKIDALTITVQRRQVLARIHYLLTQAPGNAGAGVVTQGDRS